MKYATRHLLLSGLVAALASTAFVTTASAQTGVPAASEHRMGQRDPAKMKEMIAKRLAELKTKLAITSAQEGAWATFTAAMQPPATPLARPNREEMAKLTTPERIDKMRALRAQRQSMMDARSDAIKAFYGTLSADQKKTFDAETLRLMDHMAHRGGGKG